MDGDLGNAMADMLQSWDWLENRGSKDDKVSRRIWQVVETSTWKIGVEEAERRRSKERSWKEEGRKRKEEETEKRKDDGGEESGQRMGDLGWERRSS